MLRCFVVVIHFSILSRRREGLNHRRYQDMMCHTCFVHCSPVRLFPIQEGTFIFERLDEKEYAIHCGNCFAASRGCALGLYEPIAAPRVHFDRSRDGQDPIGGDSFLVDTRIVQIPIHSGLAALRVESNGIALVLFHTVTQ